MSEDKVEKFYEVWLSPEEVSAVSAMIIGSITPAVEDRIKKIMNETIVLGIREYLKDSILTFMTGSGTNLMLGLLVGDGFAEKDVPLIDVLEGELAGLIPGNWDKSPIEFDPPNGDEDATRVKLVKALIRSYYDNGGIKQ